MHAPTILMAGVAASTEALLRETFQEIEFVPLPGARAASARSGGPAAALVNLDGDPEAGFRLVRELSSGGLRVVVLGPAKDPDVILRAMREGAKEFVLASDEAELSRVLREHVLPSGAAAGRVYAVFAAKGGVGSTTLATNLAGALQRGGDRTCLVDLDLEMGDVLAFLDLPGGYSIADLIGNVRRLDRALLDSSVLAHSSGVRVLAQSHRVAEADRIEPSHVAAMLRFLRGHYGAIVVDGLRTFDERTITALDATDEVLLVVTQEVPAVRNAQRCAALLRRLGAGDKVKLIINRFEKGLEINVDVVAETVGIPVAATVPNDYPAVIRAVNRGQLLQDEAPRSPVTKAVEQLVPVVGHGGGHDASRERPSLLKRFFTR